MYKRDFMRLTACIFLFLLVYANPLRAQTPFSIETKLTANDAANDDYFGQAVSISGVTAIAGAYGEDGIGTARGAAYIFERDHGGSGLLGPTHQADRLRLARQRLVRLVCQSLGRHGHRGSPLRGRQWRPPRRSLHL